MTKLHPVHDLQANLEAARLKVVETLAGRCPTHSGCATGTCDNPCGPVCCSGRNRDAWRKVGMGQ